MTRTLFAAIALGLAAMTAHEALARRPATEAPAVADAPLAHMVFFTLKDHSKEARAKFIASCEKYLRNQPGTSYFSVGTMAEDADEGAVSVRDFDVALHVVFKTKTDRDKYLVDKDHVAFVEDNKAQFEKVRVFDSYLSPAPAK